MCSKRTTSAATPCASSQVERVAILAVAVAVVLIVVVAVVLIVVVRSRGVEVEVEVRDQVDMRRPGDYMAVLSKWIIYDVKAIRLSLYHCLGWNPGSGSSVVPRRNAVW